MERMANNLSVFEHGQGTQKESAETQTPIEAPVVAQHRRLAPEIELLVIKYSVLHRQPCLDYQFHECYTPWRCNLMHENAGHKSTFQLANPSISLVCKSWREEALKIFFTQNTFLFNTPGFYSPSVPVYDWAAQWSFAQQQVENHEYVWEDFRPPHATRLLEFIDHPEWQGKGSAIFRQLFKDTHLVDPYRKNIRKLALVHSPCGRLSFKSPNPDWDWPLMVDWTTLPRLEELHLDLRAFGLWGQVPLSFFTSLVDCANRMACLNLKKLVVVGVYSRKAKDLENCKREVGQMFKSALRNGGECEVVLQKFIEW